MCVWVNEIEWVSEWVRWERVRESESETEEQYFCHAASTAKFKEFVGLIVENKVLTRNDILQATTSGGHSWNKYENEKKSSLFRISKSLSLVFKMLKRH